MYIRFLSVEKSPGPKAFILLLDRSSLSREVNGTRELHGTLTRELLGKPTRKIIFVSNLFNFNVYTCIFEN